MRGARRVRHPDTSAAFITLESIAAPTTDSESKLIRDLKSPAFTPRTPLVSIDPDAPPEVDEDTEQEDSRASAKFGDRTALIRMCRENYADQDRLKQDLAGVSLRDFVAVDGQVRAGSVEISGADRQRAYLALRCLQAYGTFGPIVIPSPAGS
jgi:hypothetical protein